MDHSLMLWQIAIGYLQHLSVSALLLRTKCLQHYVNLTIAVLEFVKVMTVFLGVTCTVLWDHALTQTVLLICADITTDSQHSFETSNNQESCLPTFRVWKNLYT